MEYYFFGVGRGKVGVRHAALLTRIAKNHDKNGYFVSAHMPEGDRYWFAIRSNGVPHDQNTAGKIIKEVETKKLWPMKA